MHIPEIVAEDAYTHLSPLCVSHQLEHVISLSLPYTAQIPFLNSDFIFPLHSKTRKKII